MQVIERGAVVEIKPSVVDLFRENETVEFPFGREAQAQGASPITMRVVFTDNNRVKLRGDRHTGYVNLMVNNLYNLLKGYVRNNKVVEAIMYDNRDLIENARHILVFKDGEITENFLPLYLKNYKLKLNDKNKNQS